MFYKDYMLRLLLEQWKPMTSIVLLVARVKYRQTGASPGVNLLHFT